VRVFVTGGTGFIGRAIVAALAERGDAVVVLSRREAAARADLGQAAEVIGGDPTAAGSWQSALAGCDAVINLAGAPLAERRWDARFRQLARDSRIDTTRFLVEAIAAAPTGQRPGVLAGASGVDYYPFAVDLGRATRFGEDDPIDESAPPGSTFLARLCRDWEAEARAAEAHGTRVVLLRTGLVLGPGGALDRLVTPFRLFVGGRLGRGTQWTSWVHLDDVARAYLFAIDAADLRGPVNLVAPGNATAAELARQLGARLGRPSWLPVPAWAVRAAAGELAEYVLDGRRCVPAALERAGFSFRYPELGAALAAALEPGEPPRAPRG
jgi:uncharacterized protein (TIGR01777 family)